MDKLTEEERRLIQEALPRKKVYPIGASGIWKWNGREYVHVKEFSIQRGSTRVVDMLKDGMTIEQIAEVEKVKPMSIYVRISRGDLLHAAGLKEMPWGDPETPVKARRGARRRISK